MGECEHAFASGRRILNAALIVNKVVDELKFRNKNGVLCKIDIDNAYNHVKCSFLGFMPNRIGFGTNCAS